VFVSAIVVAGGRGARLGAGVPKQMLEIGGRSILERSVTAFAAHAAVNEVIVVLPPDLADSPPAFLAASSKRVRVVAGGARRQDSVANGFDAAAPDADVVVVHDAARPFVSAALIDRTIAAAADTGAAIAALPARDTVKRANADREANRVTIAATLPRDTIHLAQTPQAFRRAVLQEAVALGRSGIEATDEAALVEYAGRPVRLVEGDPRNMKVTTPADLEFARALAGIDEQVGSAARAGRDGIPGERPAAESARHQGEAAGMRVGHGYDLHRLAEGRPLVLGGVEVPFEKGLSGHSDADVISHAVTDAILGAAAAGDIGRHFPDIDPRWKGASSLALLAAAAAIVRNAGYEIVNVDAVVVAERPRLAPHAAAMIARLSEAMGIAADRVSVKAKTNEGLGDIGRGEAIAAHAVALLRKIVPAG
jgi:2-C-methyl-D-erythritol 4-phosphate cytidylyltransferase/2-C-methyl-D-erythritol 2,4-cyclodiphosphate synthase